MKKILFLPFRRFIVFFLLSALVFSCQEDEDKPDPETYFIKAIIHNAVVLFEDQASVWATTNHIGEQFELGIYGTIGDATGIIIQVFDGESLTNSTYSGLLQAGDHLEGVRFSFVDGLENYLTDSSNPMGSVTIIQLNDTLVQGTFSGTVKELTSGETLEITNGEFLIKLVN